MVQIMVAISALLAFVPARQEPITTVQTLERNDVWCWSVGQDGTRQDCRTLTQWIVWERYADGEEHVHCWRVVQPGDLVVRVRGQWRLYGALGEDVAATVYRRIDSGYDREIADRAVVEQVFRPEPIRGWSR